MGWFGSADELSEDVLATFRGDTNQVIKELRNSTSSASQRRDIAEQVEQTIRDAAKVFDVQMQCPRAEKDPSMDQLAAGLSSVVRGATQQFAVDDATDEDIESLRDSIVSLHNSLQGLESFDYAFEEEKIEAYNGKDVRAYGDPEGEDEGEGIYAGPYAREQMEFAAEKPDQPIWIGTGTRSGNDASIHRDRLFKHATVLGPTGKGKSTLFGNIMYQLAAAGDGFCFIDPKGDDSIRLMKILPEKRLEDVIWIEPGADYEYVTGFNFLEVGIDPDDPQYDTAVENLVSDLIKLLGQGDFWGPLMDQIAQTMIRAMNMSEQDFNMIDMAYALRSPESRHEFADLIRTEGMPFIQEWTDKVERLEQEDLEALLRRFTEWILNPTVRRLIAFRDSKINIPQAVEDGKIIVVRMGSQAKEQRRMIGMAVIRRIWSAIRARAEMSQGERSPYYLIADEFDNLAAQSSSEVIETMLSESRSYRLSMMIANQTLSPLPPSLKDGIDTNTNTKISFGTRSSKQATAFAKQLGVDSQDIINTSDYRVWLRDEDPNTGEISEAYKIYNHPPMPPVRTREEALEEIEKSLKRWGKPKQTTEEIRSDIKFNVGGGEFSQPDQSPLANNSGSGARRHTGAGPGSGNGEAPDDTDIADQDDEEGLSDEQIDAALEGIFAARLKADLDRGELVEIDRAKEEVERRFGDTGYVSRLSSIFEQLPEDLVTRSTRSNTVFIGLTSNGRNHVFAQDTGSSATAGGDMHRMVLRRSYVLFTYLDYLTYLPDQSEGDGEEPDGIGDAPVERPDLDPNTMSPSKMRNIIDEWEDEIKSDHPGIWSVSEGQDLYVEAETSTFDKPVQTITNLKKAVNDGRKCIFTTKDHEENTGHYGRRIEEVFHDREGLHPSKDANLDRFTLTRMVDDDGKRVFYNERTALEFEPEETSHDTHPVVPVRPQTDASIRWYEEDGAIICGDDDNGGLAHFPSLDAYGNGEREYLEGYYQYDDEEDEYILRWQGEKRQYPTKKELRADWDEIKEPLIPELEFDEEPSPDDYHIIIFPDANNDEYDEPVVYEQGTLTPFSEYFDVEIPSGLLEPADTQVMDEADQEAEGEGDVEAESGHDPDVSADTTDDPGREAGEGSTGIDPSDERADTAGQNGGSQARSSGGDATGPNQQTTAATGHEPPAGGDTVEHSPTSGQNVEGTDEPASRTQPGAEARGQVESAGRDTSPSEQQGRPQSQPRTGSRAQSEPVSGSASGATSRSESDTPTSTNNEGETRADGAHTVQQNATPTKSEVEFPYEDATTYDGVTNQSCPDCGHHVVNIQEDKRFVGQVTGLGNFPAVFPVLSATVSMNLESKPPEITAPISGDRAICPQCGFSTTIYIPDDEEWGRIDATRPRHSDEDNSQDDRVDHADERSVSEHTDQRGSRDHHTSDTLSIDHRSVDERSVDEAEVEGHPHDQPADTPTEQEVEDESPTVESGSNDRDHEGGEANERDDTEETDESEESESPTVSREEDYYDF